MAADLFDGHADAVGVVPSAAEVLHEEGGHVAMDRADPVGGLEAEERSDEERLLVVAGIEGSGKAAFALFFNEADVEIASEVELLEDFEVVFGRQQIPRSLVWVGFFFCG